MSDELFDRDAIRARVEKRMEPIQRIQWRLGRLGLYGAIVLFLADAISRIERPIFGEMQVMNFPQPMIESLDTAGNKIISSGPADYSYFMRYPIWNTVVMAMFALWGVYALTIFLAYRRERAIQKEIDQELELQKLRLQVALRKGEDAGEKPKRGVRLSEDGELIPIEDDDGLPNHSYNKQRGTF